MTKDDILATLRASERDLRSRGVSHAALFGSFARGEAGPESDIDILIDIDPAAEISLFGYAGLKLFVASLFVRPVDVLDRASLKAHVGPPAETDAIYAF